MKNKTAKKTSLKKKTNSVELFFIGDDFYVKSRSFMSSLYVVGTKSRFHWGKVQLALAGEKVSIRLAIPSEMEWALSLLKLTPKIINSHFLDLTNEWTDCVEVPKRFP